MELMAWAPIGVILAIAIFVFFAYAFARGVAVMADRYRGIERAATGISRIYVWSKKRKSTEVGFYFSFLVSPLVITFIPGLFIAPAEALLVLLDSWYAFVASIALSFAMPFFIAPTGEEKEEYEYEESSRVTD